MSRLRSTLHDLVEQIADAFAVLGGHLGHRIEPELIEVHDAGLRASIVGLVDGERARACRRRASPRQSRDRPAEAPARPSTTKTSRSADSNRAAAALEHERVKRILAGAEHPAGVDRPRTARRAIQPCCAMHIARRPRDRRDDRAPGAGDAVEQRRLADVGTSDEHDGGIVFRQWVLVVRPSQIGTGRSVVAASGIVVEGLSRVS